MTDAGLLTSEEYGEASAKLIGMEFVATLFDSFSMLAAFRLASWSEERSPAAQMVKIFSDQPTDLESLFKIYVEFTIRLYREPVLPEIRWSVTRVFLDVFARRLGGIALLRNLRKLSSRMFGVNGVGKDQFDECFDHWMKGQGKPLIYQP